MKTQRFKRVMGAALDTDAVKKTKQNKTKNSDTAIKTLLNIKVDKNRFETKLYHKTHSVSSVRQAEDYQLTESVTQLVGAS